MLADAKRQVRALGPNSVLLADLRPSQCRWPVGATPPADHMARQMFCGEPMARPPGKATCSYCLMHWKAAHER